jgi:hypothetical protein
MLAVVAVVALAVPSPHQSDTAPLPGPSGGTEKAGSADWVGGWAARETREWRDSAR